MEGIVFPIVILKDTNNQCPPPTLYHIHNNVLSSLQVKVKSLSRVWLFATPWTVVYQAPPSMGFSRQEYWSGLPFPSPGDLPDPGIEPWCSLVAQMAKSLPAMEKTQVWSLGREDLLEKKMATHSSVLFFFLIEAEKYFIKIVQSVKVMGDLPISIPLGMEAVSPVL